MQHHMHDMAWVHWVGVALATPPTVWILVLSWRAQAMRRTLRPASTNRAPGSSTA